MLLKTYFSIWFDAPIDGLGFCAQIFNWWLFGRKNHSRCHWKDLSLVTILPTKSFRLYLLYFIVSLEEYLPFSTGWLGFGKSDAFAGKNSLQCQYTFLSLVPVLPSKSISTFCPVRISVVPADCSCHWSQLPSIRPSLVPVLYNKKLLSTDEKNNP